MKKRIFSRVLALFMALSLLSATALADVSFDDLQSVIDGTSQGTQIDGSDNLGHFWQSPGEGTEGTGYWGIESSKTDGATNITLNTDVTHAENDKTNTITIGAGQDVNLDLNDNNITGTAGSDVIDVKGDLTITGGEDEGKNVISGGATGIDVEKGGTLALDNVTVTNNDIGVSFFDNLSVTFIGDQNVVSGNKTKDISGDGKVNFELGETTYKVDAKTAETLLAGEDSVAAYGNDWILSKNGTVIYTGTGNGEKQLTQNIVNDVLNAASEGGKEVIGFVIPEGVISIGQSAFYGCENLESIVFPEESTCTKIDQYAFQECSGLKSVNIPETVTYIGYRAFKDCEMLDSELRLPTGLTFLGDDAFCGCTNLTGDVIIPAGVPKIGWKAFYGCKNLTSITFHENSGCTSIGSEAFWECTGLTGEIVIPASVTTIGQRAFNNCENVTSVKFAEGSQLKNIDVTAFARCWNLKSMVLPEGLETIGIYGTLSTLTSVVFPSTLKKVGSDAFLAGKIKNAILYATEDMSEENIKTSVEAIQVALKEKANVYVVNNNDDLEFYRGAVTANFGHYSTDNDVNRDDGSVNLTSVSGTITTDSETFTLPNVAGITASIDTYGNITINVPSAITVGDEEYPDGAIVTVNPDGTIEVVPYEPSVEDDTGIVMTPDFTFTDAGAAAGTTIEDEEVPLAGLVTLAQLLEELRQYEDIEDVELPEDFQWLDHEYAQAICWGLDEALVFDTEDEPLDPDEIVTVALLREVLENFVEYKGADLTVTVEGEDDMIVMDLGERLTVFYGELEAALEAQAA